MNEFRVETALRSAKPLKSRLFPKPGNHVGLPGLPGGAEGIVRREIGKE
jgi:hypothetical protein